MTLFMVASVVIANSIIVFSDPMYRYPIILWILNITGSVASGLGLVAVYRHGLLGPHGKSYLFLTIGLISWLSADLTLTYYYYALGIEEGKLISFADLFWISGYVFLALHLIITLKSLKNKINLGIIIIASSATLLLIAYDVINLTPSFFLTDEDLAAFVLTIAYPILDLSLIIPSATILVNLRKDYQQAIPWFLSSLSLLVNAIADDGYVHDFVNHNSHNLWFWDLFYVTDFIIMAGALFWYNKFHISNQLMKARN